jgi:hypothetical protein
MDTHKNRTPRAKFTHHTRCKLLLLDSMNSLQKQQQNTTATAEPARRAGALHASA